ncbi:DUF2064 domain-containing protein [Marivirga lumbricoides]|uniref:DUF2064 domain-containing protein n=1 Tax=Marivirga lumbricoides TaxID=1046115 RepID=UPI001664A1FE
MQRTKNIAIIFFSLNAPQQGKAKKILSTGLLRNEALNSAFINRTEKILAKVGLPVFRFDENNQKGNQFGEKLANAYQEIFDLGYESIIAVGNDSPELINADWDQIQAHLIDGKSVIGPTLRGGTYLIGLSRQNFKRDKFAQLPWQTNLLFFQLQQYCKVNNSPYSVLRKVRDINTYFDLKILLGNKYLDSAMRKFILLLSAIKQKLVLKKNLFIVSSAILLESPFRAPPSR